MGDSNHVRCQACWRTKKTDALNTDITESDREIGALEDDMRLRFELCV